MDDKLNRLKSRISTGAVYMSELLSYVEMGNIKTLNRDGVGAGTYFYEGNRLKRIDGGGLAAGNYAYDGNGNATADGRTGVSLTYNYLNLPIGVTKTGLNIAYTYNAVGTKLKKVSDMEAASDYVNGIQYTGGVIDFIITEEGKAKRNNGTPDTYSYYYDLKDHLGNSRYTFNQHPTTLQLQMLQENNYYAFGKQVGGTAINKYLYNGKELQEELGQLDYGARFYDPVIGRWNVVDPLAEDCSDMSTYNYGMNNPILMVDPDGMSSDTTKLNKPEPAPIQLKEVAIILAVNKAVDNGLSRYGPWALVPLAGLRAGRWLGHEENIHKTSNFIAEVLVKLGVDPKYLYPAEAKSKEKAGSGTPRKKSPSTLRKEWEKATGQPWPKEPSDPTKNQVAHHKKALADGGVDGMPNIEPSPAEVHRKLHKDNGDSARWGTRRGTN